MYDIKQATTARPLMFPLFQLDGVTPATGLTPTVTISKNGGTFAAVAGAVAEVGNGWYRVAGNAGDTDTLGILTLHATATGAVTTDAQYLIVAYDPADAVRLGLTALPNVASTAPGGLGQDLVALLRNAPLALAPAEGTWDEVFTVARALASGKKVQRPSANAIDYYAHDGTTLLFTLNYAPGLAAPINVTPS